MTKDQSTPPNKNNLKRIKPLNYKIHNLGKYKEPKYPRNQKTRTNNKRQLTNEPYDQIEQNQKTQEQKSNII